MIDSETLLLLGAVRDDELSPGETLDLRRRLAADFELREAAARLDRAGDAIRTALDGVAVPEGFEARMLAQVAAALPPAPRERAAGWRPLAAAAAVALCIGGLAGGGGVYWSLHGALLATGDAVLAAHLRGLAAPQPFDIASSDRHVVKPWFNGRTPVAPTAPDLVDQGFPLVGGRIDIVGDRPVPTLVYRRRLHVISVTVVPEGGREGAAGETRRDGSTLLRWRAQDLTYWAVSDLDPKELRRFAALFRARTSPLP